MIDFAIGEMSRDRSRPAFAFDKPLKHGSQLDVSFSRASLSALELNPAFVEAIEHLNAGCGVLDACDWNSDSQVSRGTASVRTGRPSRSAKVAAISSGVTRCGPSSSTTLRPLHVVWMSSAATRPMSAVATIGTGLPRGCRKLGNTPFLAAGTTSQLEFSMNHAGRKKQIGIDNSPSACSIMECCVSKFERVACAPMVDKYTTLPGRAASIADRKAAATARASRKSGDGSKFGGTSAKTPAAPLNAAVRAAASLMSASTRSQPRAAQVSPLRVSRTTPRTGWPAARRLRATSPPTLPVIPVTANIVRLTVFLRTVPFSCCCRPSR
jgi:hypothetical protein